MSKKVKHTAEKAARRVAKKIIERFSWANENSVFVYSPEETQAHSLGKGWTIEWEGVVDWASEIAWYSQNHKWMGIKLRVDTDRIKLLPNGRNALNFIDMPQINTEPEPTLDIN